MGSQTSQASGGQPKIFQLISGGDASKIRDLIRNDPNCTSLLSLGGDTVLHYAVTSEPGDQATCMNSLLDGPGIDLNALNAHGCTALHSAAAMGRVNAMRELLVSGCKPDVRDAEGQTALHIAAAGNHSACIEVASDCGVSMDLLNSHHETPLHVAATAGSTDCVKALLAGKAAVNSKTGDGQTALHIAVARGDKAIVDALMKAGADPRIQDAMLRTPGAQAPPEQVPEAGSQALQALRQCQTSESES